MPEIELNAVDDVARKIQGRDLEDKPLNGPLDHVGTLEAVRPGKALSKTEVADRNIVIESGFIPDEKEAHSVSEAWF